MTKSAQSGLQYQMPLILSLSGHSYSRLSSPESIWLRGKFDSMDAPCQNIAEGYTIGTQQLIVIGK